jgi:hypothetical protein
MIGSFYMYPTKVKNLIFTYYRAENWTVWGLENGLNTLVEELTRHLNSSGVEIFTQYNINNIAFK